jgi:lauroyl/myristoyl acyltransferase
VVERVTSDTGAVLADRAAAAPRRWTLHGLNNGAIFSATYYGVRTLPRAVSYALGHAGTWLAWRLMARTRAALADNLAPVLPGESRAALERRALATFRSYALDVIDFLRALGAPEADRRHQFRIEEEHRPLFETILGQGRGMLLVTGHYGNWEVGSVLVRRALGIPMTIVAMAEPNPTVNRIRHEIRTSLGAETIEVRQSLETALQIRRCLAGNQVVAMLVDRHFGRDRVPVTFFGRQAWLLRTPLLMAYLSGAPLVPCFIERTGPGRFLVRPGTPLFMSTVAARDQEIARAAQQLADELAARVREHPEFWYHFYRFWDAQRDEYGGLE